MNEAKIELAFALPDMTTIAAIVTIIAGLFAIGFGIRRISSSVRKRKPHAISDTSGPGFHEFMTEAAKANRESYQKILIQRARLIAKKERIKIEDIVPGDAEDLIEPFTSLPPKTYLVDTMCTAFTREGKTILILPSAESQRDIEAVGRTHVLLRLLGLRVHTGRLFGLKLEKSDSFEEIPIEQRIADRWCYLLATDIAFLGSSGKKLSVVPTKGEKISFLWDLARHIFRTTELGYRTGDHRKDPGRQKLMTIFEKIPFKPLNNIFGNLDRLYLVDEVILLRRNISPDMHPPEIRELKGDERIQELCKGLLVSRRHGSLFWQKKENKLESFVDQIIDSLDKKTIPHVFEICFSYHEPEVPTDYFDQIANMIRTKENPVTGEKPETMTQIKGIAFHNYLLITRIAHVDEVRLLVTSGEKIFSEKQFWESLLKIKRPMTLRILMLNPEAPAASKRQEEAYADRPPGYLVNEIRENIGTISRMRGELNKIANGVRISCALYDELPPFRLTFIGTETLLVTSYKKSKRTGDETEFYKITHQEMGALFEGFNLEYRRVESLSRTIFES